MNPVEYVESIKGRLLIDSLVLDYDVFAERASEWEGYVRMRVFLSDGSYLDFSEYITPTESGALEIVSYRYQWMDKDKNLIRRWDNARHHSGLENFPHHIHNSGTEEVMSGKPVNIFAVLHEIAATL